MKDYKILFTGSVCSGKTTAIRSLSDIETLDTDAQASDVTVRRKKNTTIAMDYGVLDLTKDARVHLYGTPGQERFRFMWEMLACEFAHDAIGMVLMVDNTRKDPFRDIRFYAKEFSDYLQKRRLIIAVTHADVEANPDYQGYLKALKDLGIMTTVMFIDARDPRAVLGIVEELISAVERDINWDLVCERLLDNNGFSLDFYKPLYEETLLDAAMNKRGVLGAIHLGDQQEVLCSNIDDKATKSLMCNLDRLSSAISDKASFLGAVNNIVIAGAKCRIRCLFLMIKISHCVCVRIKIFRYRY